MSQSIDRELAQIRKLLSTGRTAQAERSVASLRPADRADLLAELSAAEQDMLLDALNIADAASTLQEMDDELAVPIATRLDDARLAQIIDTMEPDEAADLLNDLESTYRARVLNLLETRDDLLPLLAFPDDTAGGLMRADYMSVSANATAGDALQRIQRRVTRGRESSYFAVVDAEGVLVGMTSIFRVLRAPAEQAIADLMDPKVLKVQAMDRAEEAAHLVAHYRLDLLPVVDASDHLLGSITADDLVQVLEDAATEDVQRFGGSAPLQRRYMNVSPLAAALKRIGWLALLFATGTLTAAIIRSHQGTLDGAAALAAFIPLLVGSGGNAGSQTTATVIRALTVREIVPRDLFRVLWQEGRTGLLLGLAMSLGGFAIVQLSGAGLLIALTVAASLLSILLFSGLVGAMLPLAARAAGLDPALISGPLLSTVVDTVGLLIYFGIARWLLL